MKKMKWKKIGDSHVRHRWDRACGDKFSRCDSQEEPDTVYVYPQFYADSGTPVCGECGQDRDYVGTEILVKA